MQPPRELARVESFDRSCHPVIGLDATAAIHLAPKPLRVLQLRRRVLDDRLLIASGIRKIFVEAFVPWALYQTARRREVVRRRKGKPGAFTEAVNRLHERLAPRRFSDEKTAIVVLKGPRHDFGRARAAAVCQRNQRQVGVFAVFDAVIVLV